MSCSNPEYHEITPVIRGGIEKKTVQYQPQSVQVAPTQVEPVVSNTHDYHENIDMIDVQNTLNATKPGYSNKTILIVIAIILLLLAITVAYLYMNNNSKNNQDQEVSNNVKYMNNRNYTKPQYSRRRETTDTTEEDDFINNAMRKPKRDLTDTRNSHAHIKENKVSNMKSQPSAIELSDESPVGDINMEEFNELLTDNNNNNDIHGGDNDNGNADGSCDIEVSAELFTGESDSEFSLELVTGDVHTDSHTSNEDIEQTQIENKKSDNTDELISIPKYVQKEAQSYSDEEIRILTNDAVKLSTLVSLKQSFKGKDFVKFMNTKRMREKLLNN